MTKLLMKTRSGTGAVVCACASVRAVFLWFSEFTNSINLVAEGHLELAAVTRCCSYLDSYRYSHLHLYIYPFTPRPLVATAQRLKESAPARLRRPEPRTRLAMRGVPKGALHTTFV